MLFVFQILDYIKSNLVDVLLISSLISVFFVVMVVNNINFNDVEPMTLNKIEGQISHLSDDELDKHIKENAFQNKDMEASEHFCKINDSDSSILEGKCNSLGENVCKKTGCCVFMQNDKGNKKCVAGSSSGPTFLSDDNNALINIDFYYYMNKCYGKNCNN